MIITTSKWLMTETCIQTRFLMPDFDRVPFNICMLSSIITLIYLLWKIQKAVILYLIFCHLIWQQYCFDKRVWFLYWPKTFIWALTDGAVRQNLSRENFITMRCGQYKSTVRVDWKAVFQSYSPSWDCFSKRERI